MRSARSSRGHASDRRIRSVASVVECAEQEANLGRQSFVTMSERTLDAPVVGLDCSFVPPETLVAQAEVLEGGAFIPGTTNTFGGDSAAEYGPLLPLVYAPAIGRGQVTRFNDFRNVMSTNPCDSSGNLPI